MSRYIIRRLLQAIPTFFGITIISYFIMVIAPGDPVSLLTFDPTISPQHRQRLAAQLGVHDPLPIQYLRWLAGDDWMRWDSDGDGVSDGAFLIPLDADGDGVPEPPGERLGILRGDFGRSFRYREPALKLIGDYLPATIELNLAVIAVTLAVGIPIGILAAIYRGKWFDNVSRVFAVLGSSIPIQWLGLILIIVFGPLVLNLLPMGGRCAPVRGGCPPIYGRIEYLVLPTFVLAVGGIAGWSRFMRASMLENINSDYVRTARSKGLPNRLVWFKHTARNALVPMATFLGPTLVSFLGGSVITETIFSWPGVGRFLVQSISGQDYPVIMAEVVIGAVLTIIAYLLSDILYAVFDPRIRLN
jgi:peptide/nickel transport system permease protein